MGPGYLVAVGYMDPGNWATALAGGSKFGYALLPTAILSSLMAMLLQALCARLGVASGRDLAQACRDAYPEWLAKPLWVLAELAICATDLAEVIGTAIGLKLLFGIPLEIGVLVTACDVFLVLWMQHLGFRWVESFIVAMLLVIALCFGIQIALANPDWGDVIRGLMPTTAVVTNPDMLYLALGIIGATVMPHNLYLHSALVQTRQIGETATEKREAIKLATLDSTLALIFALVINASILILAAATFHKAGRTDIAELGQAHSLLHAAAWRDHRAVAVRRRAAVLRPQLRHYRDALRASGDGGLSQHPPGAVAAPADHPGDRHRAGGDSDDLGRRAGHGEALDPQPGDLEPATAVRHGAAGDVHRRQAQARRLRRAALAQRRRGACRRAHHCAQHQADD